MNKKYIFKKKEIGLSAFAKSISHPARIAILKILSEEKFCTCGVLVSKLPLAQSTISQHLKELQKVQLIKKTEKLTTSYYSIDVRGLADFSEQIKSFIKKVED